MKNRPESSGCIVTTPGAARLQSLLGSAPRQGSVAPTHDEYRALQRLYGYVPEKSHPRPPEPSHPGPDATWDEKEKYKRAKATWDAWSDPKGFLQAGADVNLYRHAEVDGLRLVAWIARFIAPGADPLKALILLASEAGWNVDLEDIEYAQEEEEPAG